MKDQFDSNELPEDYVPSDYDVICGWARQNYHHAGNQMLRNLIQENVARYTDAGTKTEKGHVIIEILEKIRSDSPTGVGLVRQNQKTGRWSFIGLEKAKDKIGHALRKASKERPKLKKQRKRRPATPDEDISPIPSEKSRSTPDQRRFPPPRPYSSVFHTPPPPLPNLPAPSATVSYDEEKPSKTGQYHNAPEDSSRPYPPYYPYGGYAPHYYGYYGHPHQSGYGYPQYYPGKPQPPHSSEYDHSLEHSPYPRPPMPSHGDCGLDYNSTPRSVAHA